MYALDYDQDILNYLSKESNGGINCFMSNNLLLYKEKFNSVFSFDVFEHLLDPLEQAKLIYKSLKSNGSCITSVPNFNSYLHRLNLSINEYFVTQAILTTLLVDH